MIHERASGNLARELRGEAHNVRITGFLDVGARICQESTLWCMVMRSHAIEPYAWEHVRGTRASIHINDRMYLAHAGMYAYVSCVRALYKSFPKGICSTAVHACEGVMRCVVYGQEWDGGDVRATMM